jgi:1,4-dihydroxy-6-naphthoate synthase
MTTLRFGYSPCPNDTVQFAALALGLIDTGELRFEPVLEDVETLNRWALEGRLEVTKASYGVVGAVLPRYGCLRAGGALGRGCGPLWVAREPRPVEELARLPIAHPGVHTTAHLLLNLRLGGRFTGVPMVFHEVMDRVAAGEIPSGVIIHEGRFTYRERGLAAVEDLGEWWERETGRPIPLGAILLRRDAGVDPLHVERCLRESLRYGRAHPEKVMAYVRAYAQEMAEDVVARHIALYVNDFSEDVGPEGEAAVRTLLDRQREIGAIPPWEGPVFPYLAT